jgi:3-(3-hydroxy-phenyl)propionate hydroxylase
VTDLPTRHNYVLGLWQSHTERLLAEWVDELGVTILRGREVAAFAQDESGVDVALSDGASLCAAYLVGCDGGRSVVRKTAGIEFAGWNATVSWLIAEAQMRDEPKWGFHEDANGIHAIGKGDGGTVRLVLTERDLRVEGERSLRDVSEALVAIYGTDFGIHAPRWISRFTDLTRQAAAYRSGRVLLAGDAAHVHPPVGGQGLNLGVQDAANLGWKLAQVVKRVSPDTLLDSYHAERHPVAARVLRNTMAQVALRRTDARTKALGDAVAEILRMDEPRKQRAAEMCGLDVSYDLGGSHPLVGRRVPDLKLITTDGPAQLYTLLHGARPLLLNLGPADAFNLSRGAHRVKRVDATFADRWVLPVVGAVAAPAAVLIRPDGHAAWVADAGQPPIDGALSQWFGASTA